MRIRNLIGLVSLMLLALPAALAQGAPQGVLLHSRMGSADDIFRPTYAAGTYATLAEAIPGPSKLAFVPGQSGNATQIQAAGFQYNWPIDGPARFHGANFDFADPAGDGGEFHMLVRFDVNPHTTTANTWIGRSNWGDRFVNFEFAGSSGSPAYLMFDFYSNVPMSDRTNYSNFRVTPKNPDADPWPLWNNVAAGEWHWISLRWRNNGAQSGKLHNDELHVYIDGSQQGCKGCNDYNGNMPPVGGVTDFFLSPVLRRDNQDQYFPSFTLDEICSFDRWHVASQVGNCPQIQIPEGVSLTYPLSNTYPWYGSPVKGQNVVFEFFAINNINNQFTCDLYVDGSRVNSASARSEAHTEVAAPAALALGVHSYQVKCDNNRLVSPVWNFEVQAGAALPTPTPDSRAPSAPENLRRD